MMTLDNFETEISDVILERGKQYFAAGSVLYLVENEAGKWEAEVEGQEVYAVEVVLKKKQIVSYFCDCPYDGDTCKHAVAVFYKLRAEAKNPPKKAAASKKEMPLAQLVQQLKLEELRTFVWQHATSDKEFATRLRVHFSDKDQNVDVAQKFAKLIQQAIRQHSDRGYVDYQQARSLAREVKKIVATGEAMRESKNYPDAITVGLTVAQELTPTLENTDDASGALSDTISAAIELLVRVAQSPGASSELLRALFARVAAEIGRGAKHFDFGDAGYELLGVAREACFHAGDHDAFLKYLDDQVRAGWPGRRWQQLLRTAKIDYLKRLGRTREARVVTEQNLEIEEVRQRAVDDARKQRDFVKARKLLLDGIAQAPHSMLAMPWEVQLLAIAELEKDVPTVRQLTKKFAFEWGFKPQYYHQWKATYPATEWKVVIDEWLEDAAARVPPKSMLPSLYGQSDGWFITVAAVLTEEQYWAQLLALVQNSPNLDRIEATYDQLANHFPESVLSLPLPLLSTLGHQATVRPAYKRVADGLKRIKKDVPGSQAQVSALAKGLRDKFPRRVALLEELSGV